MTKTRRTLRIAAIAAVASLVVTAVAVAAQPRLLPEPARRMLPSTDDGNNTTDRHGLHKLAVFVGARGHEGPSFVAGAHVTVYRITRDGPGSFDVVAVARGVTDDQGKAGFALPRGAYGIKAEKEEAKGGARTLLSDDARIFVGIHRAGDRVQDGPLALGIRAAMRGDDGPVAAAGARYAIEKHIGTLANARAGDGTWETAATGTLDGRGMAAEVLPPGAYRVTVTTDGLEGHERVLLRHDQWVRIGLHAPHADASIDPVPTDGSGMAPDDAPPDPVADEDGEGDDAPSEAAEDAGTSQ